MKGPKAKEKIRETRRQIEQLLQLVGRIEILVFRLLFFIFSQLVIAAKSSHSFSNINKYK
jgi:hypothetical protein